MLAVYLVNIVNVWHSKLLFIGKKQQAIPPYNVFLSACKNSQWEKVWKLFLIIVFVVELLSPALPLQVGDSFLSSVGTEVKIQRTTLLAGSLIVRFPNPMSGGDPVCSLLLSLPFSNLLAHVCPEGKCWNIAVLVFIAIGRYQGSDKRA